MIKKAGIEESTVADPATGLPIRVSTTVRKVYRKKFRGMEEGYERMKNAELNEIIAEYFAASSSKVVHYFKLGKIGEQDRTVAEIRNRSGSTMFYISAIRGGNIDVLTLQNAWKSPKFTSRYGIRKKKDE